MWSNIRQRWLPRVAGYLGPLLLHLYFIGIRKREINKARVEALRQRGCSIIFVLWHEHMLLPLYCNRGRPIAVLVSHHFDGEIIARILTRLGYHTIRGSSTRGGSMALEQMVHWLSEPGREVAITPDGPRGPRRKAKPGAARLALKTGAPIVPVSVVASRARRLQSWDRFLLLLPGSQAVLNYGHPVYPASIPTRDVAALTEKIEEALWQTEQEALQWLVP